MSLFLRVTSLIEDHGSRRMLRTLAGSDVVLHLSAAVDRADKALFFSFFVAWDPVIAHVGKCACRE